MQAALVALLGVSAILPLGSSSLEMALVVAGSFLCAIVLLFGACLFAGWIGTPRIAGPSIVWTLPSSALAAAKASTDSLGRAPASQRLRA
jgi:hypothetical protein